MITLAPQPSLMHETESAGKREVGRGLTLELLAAIWLLGCLDLRMSVLAVRYEMLDAYSESNPLAAVMLSVGLWALVLYKILLSVGGSVTLVVCRRMKLARRAAPWLLLAYVLVTMQWVYLYGTCVPFRERAPHFGCFCAAASETGWVLLVAIVGLSLVVSARIRAARANHSRAAGKRTRWPFPSRITTLVATTFLLMPLSCFPDHPPESQVAPAADSEQASVESCDIELTRGVPAGSPATRTIETNCLGV